MNKKIIAGILLVGVAITAGWFLTSSAEADESPYGVSINLSENVLFDLFKSFKGEEVQEDTFGSAISGTPALGRRATTTEVGIQENKKLFDSSSACTSRVISTLGKPIMLSFGEVVKDDNYYVASSTLSATLGHLQSASTTVAYDSGIYGCGEWYAYGHDASTTIITLELN